MKKATKGALAAAAAGSLLIGGFGSLAYWSDTKTVDGGSIASGSITLSAVSCPTNFTHTEAGSNPTVVTKIVPGDTITKQCTGTLVLVGDHIGATVALDPASITSLNGSLGTEVTAAATMVSPAATVSLAGNYTVTINIDVTFPTTVTSVASQNSTASLNTLSLVATQTHV
jgi:alternate signal-mediated exported protein